MTGTDHASHPVAYRPYPVDWRFLPDRMLLIKDVARYYLVAAADAWASSGVLNGLWHGSFGDRVSRAVERAGVLLIHAPKTGGTSISRLLYGRNLPHYPAAFYDRVFGAAMSRHPRFAVVRHPTARFVSAYNFLAAGGSDIMLTSRFEHSRLRCAEPIDQFVKFLHDDPRRMRVSPLFATQASFLTSGGDIRVDRLFQMSEEEGISRALTAWLGIPELPHLNRGNRNPVLLSPASLAMLRTMYATDFELFKLAGLSGQGISLRGHSIGDGVPDDRAYDERASA